MIVRRLGQSRMAFSEKLGHTPSIIFLIFLNLHFVWKSVLSRRVFRECFFPENHMKSSFDSVDQNFEINWRRELPLFAFLRSISTKFWIVHRRREAAQVYVGRKEHQRSKWGLKSEAGQFRRSAQIDKFLQENQRTWCETWQTQSGESTLSGDSPRGAFGQFRRFQRKSGRFWKNLTFEESSSQSTTLCAKHSSICLLSSPWKRTYFLLRGKFRASDWVSENFFCGENKLPSFLGLGI